MNKKAYFILEISIQNPDGMQPYLAKGAESLTPYHGKMLASGTNVIPLEGDKPLERIVVIEFPSMDDATAWYHSDLYQQILPARLQSAINRSYFVEGL